MLFKEYLFLVCHPHYCNGVQVWAGECEVVTRDISDGQFSLEALLAEEAGGVNERFNLWIEVYSVSVWRALTLQWKKYTVFCYLGIQPRFMVRLDMWKGIQASPSSSLLKKSMHFGHVICKGKTHWLLRIQINKTFCKLKCQSEHRLCKRKSISS